MYHKIHTSHNCHTSFIYLPLLISLLLDDEMLSLSVELYVVFANFVGCESHNLASCRKRVRAWAAAWSGFIFLTSPLEKQYLFVHFGLPHPSVSWKKYRSISFRAATRFISSLPWSLVSIFPSKFLPLSPLPLLFTVIAVVVFGEDEEVVDNVDDSSGILSAMLRVQEIKLHLYCFCLMNEKITRIFLKLLRVFVCTFPLYAIFSVFFCVILLRKHKISLIFCASNWLCQYIYFFNKTDKHT